jgi:hypothetical protein
MTNLDLHNALLKIAKETERLKELHPELTADIHTIEALFPAESVVRPFHPPGPLPYHKGGSNAS